MPLSSGTRLGPYEILAPLGAGGMGEVYKARDTRLDRSVAIKVLPDESASDPMRLHRFEQEARAASALNHPHICVLYDIGRDGDTDFLVMEHLEGETLAHRLRKGPLPIAHALELGAQVADALDRAHRHGIVHRDIMPANVMLTKDGANLLDFGLAKLRPDTVLAGGAAGLSTASVVSSPGAIVGTLPYMAPEQLEGKETDARTDLVAFGAVLYEMLAGRRAFPGDTEASVISAIMTGEPPALSSVQPLARPELDRLVKGCLAKNPDVRRQSAHDVAEELRSLAAADAAAPRRAGRARAAWRRRSAALALAIALGALGWRAWTLGRPAPPLLPRVTLTAPLTHAIHSVVTLHPDGTGVLYPAYASYGPDNAPLFWHGVTDAEPNALPGTDGAESPFFCPDGRTIGFGRRGKLVTLPFRDSRVPEGAPPVELATVGWLRGASCGEDGSILYSPHAYGGLWHVGPGGRSPRQLTTPDSSRRETSHRWPSILPGGRAALFTIMDASERQDRGSVAVLSLDTGRWERVVERGTYGRYLPTGHLVYALNGALLAVRFDLATLKASGAPVPVQGRVSMSGTSSGPVSRNIAGLAFFDVSRSGALVYAPDLAVSPRHSLVWLDRDGAVEALAPEQDDYRPSLQLSPDGRKLAVIRPGQGFDNLWVYDLRDRRWQQLTREEDVQLPIWSPGGDRLAFASNRPGQSDLYVMDADGDEEPQRASAAPGSFARFPSAWSPDGRYLAYQEQHPEGGWNTWVLPLDGSLEPWVLDTEGRNVTLPAFSPDGHWVAYQTNEDETGRFEIYVRPFPGPGPRRVVSGQFGGVGPVWAPTGREVLFMTAGLEDRRIMATVLPAGLRTAPAPPRLAFALPFPPNPAVFPYFRRMFSVTPDGRRVAVVRPDSRAPYELKSLAVVSNWARELKATLSAAGR